jgi:hypothetical protein
MSNDKYMCWGDNSCPCNDASWKYCPYWSCLSWATWKKAEPSALLERGVANSNFSLGTCNPVNFTILKPSDWEQGHKIGIMINGKELDPRTLLHLKLITITHESSSYQVFHFFYEEVQSGFPISVKSKNLFLSLAESITQTLNVTLCYVCGGTDMGDHWLWEARELNPQAPFKETTLPCHRESIWLLKTSIIWNNCISYPKRLILHPSRGLDLLGKKF